MPVEMIPLLVCESCHKRVFGDSGFLIVNAVEAARRQREVTHFLPADKGIVKPPALVNWHILHRDCAPEATAITSPFFRSGVQAFPLQMICSKRWLMRAHSRGSAGQISRPPLVLLEFFAMSCLATS